jgi:hypothetical protein
LVEYATDFLRERNGVSSKPETPWEKCRRKSLDSAQRR